MIPWASYLNLIGLPLSFSWLPGLRLLIVAKLLRIGLSFALTLWPLDPSGDCVNVDLILSFLDLLQFLNFSPNLGLLGSFFSSRLFKNLSCFHCLVWKIYRLNLQPEEVSKSLFSSVGMIC